jgi:ParB family chromosome partitioning protein
MELQHINFEELRCSPINVRKKGGKLVSDLVPPIRELGIIQPLLVRANGTGFEIIAGQRRYHALQSLTEEQTLDPVPCLVMEKGDDAKAIEASLAENVSRLPMDDIDQFKAFSALIKQGLSIEDIASRFAIDQKQVKQRLAIADLIPPLITAYRRQKIDASTLRTLTMATKKQQRAWLELFRSDNAPEGYALKRWLFSGAEIDVENALFDLGEYDGVIVTDLFEEQRYFSDPEKFWALQSRAVAELKDKYLKASWSDVTILDIGEYFPSYEYVDTAKKDGGTPC